MPVLTLCTDTGARLGCNPLRRTPWVTVRLACQQVYTPRRLRVPPGAPVLNLGLALSSQPQLHSSTSPVFSSVLHVQQLLSPWRFLNNCLQALLTRGCCRSGLRSFAGFPSKPFSVPYLAPCTHYIYLGYLLEMGGFYYFNLTIMSSVLLTNQKAPLPCPRLCVLALFPS